MKKVFIVKFCIIIVILQITSCQLIMGSPLAKEFHKSAKSDIKLLNKSIYFDREINDKENLDEMDIIEVEIEESLIKAANVLDDIYNKVKGNQKPSDDEMLETLQYEVAKLHEDQESNSKKNLPEEIIIAENLIGETILQELQDELEKDEIFANYNEQDKEYQDRKEHLKSKKKDVSKILDEEKKWFQDERSKLIEMPKITLPSTEYRKQSAEREKAQKENLNKQKNIFKKIKGIAPGQPDVDLDNVQTDLNKENNKEEWKEKHSIKKTSDYILQSIDKSDSIFNKDSEQLKKQGQIIDQEGKILSQISRDLTRDKKKFAKQNEQIDELLQQGNKLHEKFLEQTGQFETAVVKNSQLKNEEQVNEIKTESKVNVRKQKGKSQNKNKQLESKLIELEVNQKEQEENQNTFYKQIAFSVIMLFVLLFVFLGTQFDMLTYFTQGRRAKDPIYTDDETQQSLLS